MRSFFPIYVAVSFVIALIDLVVAIRSYDKRTVIARYLGHTAIGALLVDLTYLAGVSTANPLLFSVMESLYFICIDFMLLALLRFISVLVRRQITPLDSTLFRVLRGYAIFDVIVFAINPFYNIAISYVHRPTPFSQFAYVMKPLYVLHLVFTYLMVLLVLLMLIVKSVSVPKQYRNQYLYSVIAIVAIVVVNACFLYLYQMIDFSIIGYSIALLFLYWSCFFYAANDMLKNLSMTIFNNIDQGIVLFDYDGYLAMKNARAEHLLYAVNFSESMHMEDLMHQCGISLDDQTLADTYSLQCYVADNLQNVPLRCDFRRLRDEKGHTIGNLYVFTDVALETDLLTGFHNWENFRRHAEENAAAYHVPMGIAVFDINNLGILNSSYGKEAGDRKICSLAEIMRESANSETYYVRGRDAYLFALCYHSDEKQMTDYAKRVAEAFDGELQYAVVMTERDQLDILSGMDAAIQSLQTKKLLDKQSTRSQMLSSLVRALQVSDSDTEAHVQRTQMLGAELGQRIGLTDAQQAELSLLCLLHDIGKIGIPLEILNKPGALTDEEWVVMRTHPRKGYQIAKSSTDLAGVADMILHHHESWDGSGYPDGLSRESIPILSRIIAVVDTYDAMVNHRPYRRALSSEQAQSELRRCAGTQLDPYIVSEFIQMLRENPQLIMPPEGTVRPTAPQETAPRSQASSSGTALTHTAHPVQYSRYLLDEWMNIVWVDDAFEAMTGYTLQDVQENHMKQVNLIPPDERTDYLLLVEEQLSKNQRCYLEHRLMKKDGSTAYVFCYGKNYYDSAANEARSEIIISNSASTYAVKIMAEAENNKASQRLRHWEMAYRQDSLTGLLNHAAFQNDVEMKLLRGENRILLMMMDVDNFKSYNDIYGHSAGDEFLILISQTLKSTLRKDDLACRMGGDEFAAALFFCKDVETDTITERAQQIFDKLNMTLKAMQGSTSMSMGAALSDDGITFKQLYQTADQALYQSKKHGRERISFAFGNPAD